MTTATQNKTRVRNTGNTTAKSGSPKKATETVSPRHGGLRRWFGDLEVVEAKSDLRIQPNREDIKSAIIGDPMQCAFSRACQRMWSSTVVVFFGTVAYVDLLDEKGVRRVERFIIPGNAREFIRSFDAGHPIDSRGFILRAPSKSMTVDASSARNKKRNALLKGRMTGTDKAKARAIRLHVPKTYNFDRRSSFFRNGTGMVHFSKSDTK